MQVKKYITQVFFIILLFSFVIPIAGQTPPTPPPSHYVMSEVDIIATSLNRNTTAPLLAVRFNEVFNRPRIDRFQGTLTGDMAIVENLELYYDTNADNLADENDRLLATCTLDEAGAFEFSLSDTLDQDDMSYLIMVDLASIDDEDHPIRVTLDGDAFGGDDTYFDFRGYESEDILVHVDPVGDRILPKRFRLIRNYPNPFNSSTRLQIGVPNEGRIKVVVFNIAGQEIVTLLDEVLIPGWRVLSWNGKDRSGRLMPSGIYIVQAMMGPECATVKLQFLK